MNNPSFRPNHGLSLQIKLIVLWACFLLGMLFHTQLALMPLFHGLTVAESHTHEYLSLNAIFWLMLMVFTLPLLMMISLLFTEARPYRRFHFGLTLMYSLINFLHLTLDVWVKAPHYQLCLMALLFALGLLLNRVSYLWMRGSISPHLHVSRVKALQ
ncbi:MAG: hypothetical protein HC934_02580 [Acaryochloridaceae cyanobacterium SU_2_1]|nr:hypothetical protein [Acaryochloridaceae cyanobacterium SU_2_1]